MFEAIVSDVVGVFKSVFMAGDMIGLAIAAGAVLVSAMVMQRGSQIGSMTLLALVLFALGGFVRGFLHKGEAAADGAAASGRAVGQLNASWAEFSGMQAGNLLAYFIAFMVLVLIVYGLKAALSRG